MTRYAIDAPTAVRLARDDVTMPDEHALVGPSILRSHAMSLLYGSVRSGELDEAEALLALDRITTMRIRLLGDRVSRAVAWKLATQLGWDDTAPAEYLAVAKLQADAFVTLDPGLERAARGIVPVASIDDLYGRH
ncbi:type II toxin-antitoxin system VapC family toxin [Agromyces sp. H66]|uniref:type II toxin-antitoxin system VapC family toxin n=1 Tax=Agromyces sp. H66 TaxID=2529859 RepID=UPI0010A9E454|nr:type II toxin-antitoxin system VapC family toxin [Agromyces sp. H66]